MNNLLELIHTQTKDVLTDDEAGHVEKYMLEWHLNELIDEVATHLYPNKMEEEI